MTDQPATEPSGEAPPPAPAAPPVPPSAPPPAPGRAPASPPGGWSSAPVATQRPAGPRNTSWRAAIVVVLVILGVVLGANFVNAALPLPTDPAPVDPGPGVPAEPDPSGGPQQPGESLTPIRSLPPLEPGPVEPGESIGVGGGYLLTPPEGWSVVGGEDGLTVLQKGSVTIIVGGIPWSDTPTALAELYRDAWFAGGELTGDAPSTGEIGDGIPAAVIGYTGVAQGQAIDGAIVAGAVDGDGLIFNVFGPAGSLGVSDDIDQLLGTISHTGG